MRGAKRRGKKGREVEKSEGAVKKQRRSSICSHVHVSMSMSPCPSPCIVVSSLVLLFVVVLYLSLSFHRLYMGHTHSFSFITPIHPNSTHSPPSSSSTFSLFFSSLHSVIHNHTTHAYSIILFSPATPSFRSPTFLLCSFIIFFSSCFHTTQPQLHKINNLSRIHSRCK